MPEQVRSACISPQIEHRLFAHITTNWRGRPLTSHEVIVNSIAATTTRTGLTVCAQLDTSTYATGVQISDRQMDALPVTRHAWHGDWNYTLHPAPPQRSTDDASHAPPTPRPEGPDRTWLRAPALTGLTPAQWERLIEKLGVVRHAQREAQLHDRRGGARRVASGTGRRSALTLDDRAAITLLDLRFSMPKPVLEELFEVTRTTVNNVIRQTRPLLDLVGHAPNPPVSGSTAPPTWPGSQPTRAPRHPRRSNQHVNNLHILNRMALGLVARQPLFA